MNFEFKYFFSNLILTNCKFKKYINWCFNYIVGQCIVKYNLLLRNTNN